MLEEMRDSKVIKVNDVQVAARGARGALVDGTPEEELGCWPPEELEGRSVPTEELEGPSAMGLAGRFKHRLPMLLVEILQEHEGEGPVRKLQGA